MIGFPYTNFHRLNLDALIKIVEKLVDDVKKIPTRTSQLINDSGFITEEQATGVISVNGQTGEVTLTAADVGAKPSSYEAPVQSVNGKIGAVSLNASDVGAKPSSYEAPVQSVNGATGDVQISVPEASTSNPVMDGTVAIGTSGNYARADHRHPKDTSKANLASPTFTGTPKAPTAATGTNTTQLATTAFVQQERLTNEAGSLTASSIHSGVTVRSASYTKNNRVVQFNATLNITTAQTNETVLFKLAAIKGPATQCTLLARSSSTGNIVSISLQNVDDQLTVVAFGSIPVGDWLFITGTYIQQV